MSWLLLTGLAACSDSAHASDYAIRYEASFSGDKQKASVTISVKQTRASLRQLTMTLPEQTVAKVSADGDVTRDANQLSWEIPKQGGELHYELVIKKRRAAGYDALINPDWALLRFEDLFPIASSRTRSGAIGNAEFFLTSKDNWSFETRYGRLFEKAIAIESPGRRLNRPTGWLIAGNLGIRRTQTQHHQITVAAPAGSRYQRLPTLSFLRWTLPSFHKVFPMLPQSVLIVSGDDTMWRGALSGPSSLYLHPSRPLISENSTSTLLHELVHVATRWRAAPGDDWIVEGVAEYYALEMLRRSDGISEQRYQDALVGLQKWVDADGGRLAHPSKGANTAAAVLLFVEIDRELRAQGTNGMDDVIEHLVKPSAGPRNIARGQLIDCLRTLLGKESVALSAALKAARL